MKAKKWLIVVLSAIMALAVAFGVAACGVDKYDHANDTFEWTDNADGTHNGKASCDDRTHDVANEAHTWGTDNKCTKCGAEKPQEQPQHKFATGWTTDANNHWHICENHPTDTADVSGKAAHADANKDGKCDTCQYQMTKPTPDPEHKFATGWTTDQNNHWHICENHPTDTADVSEKGEHVDANNDGKCDTCEYDMPSDIPTPPELEEGWYVMGTVASLPTVNWNTYVKEGFVGTDLTITLTLTATDEFKFCKYVEADSADVNWNNGQIGYTAANADLFTGAGQPTGDNFKAKVEGQYTFTLNVTANTATVTKVEEECDHQWKWQSNDTQHWQVCDLCGAEKEGSRVAHDQLSEETNTEQHWKECATCGYVSTKTNHTLTWQSTAEQHWQKCNGCDYTTDKVAHDAKELKKDETGHWYECSTCNWEETPHRDHDFGTGDTCIEPGCGFERDHQHSWGAWQTDNEKHWRECTAANCDGREEAPHTFEEGWTSDGEATHSHKTTCTEHEPITVTEDHHLSVEANDTQHWNKCSDCTYTSTPVNHDWSYADKEDGEHHTKTSTCEGHEAKTVEEAHTWGDNDECTFCHAKKPVPQPEGEVFLLYAVGGDWQNSATMTFTEIKDVEDGRHFQLVTPLTADTEFVLYEKLSGEEDTYYNYGHTEVRYNTGLFTGTQGDEYAGNYVVVADGNYTFDFYFETVFNGAKQNPNFTISKEGDEPKPEAGVYLISDKKNWEEGKLTFTEDLEFQYDGRHFVLENIELEAGEEICLYETLGGEATYYHYANISGGQNLFTEKGFNFTANAAGTYTFEFYYGTKMGDAPQDPNFVISKVGGDEPGPQPGTLQAGWYIVGKIASNSKINWDNYAADGFVGTDGVTITLAVGDEFKFSKFGGGTSTKVDWTDANVIGWVVDGAKWFTKGTGESGGNFVVKADCAGEYNFKISTSKALTITTEVEGVIEKPDLQNGWYVVGSIKSLPTVNWDNFVKEGYIADNSITLHLKITDQFTIYKYDGAPTTVPDYTVGQIKFDGSKHSQYFKGAGGFSTDFQALKEGTYTFTISGNSVTITMEGQTDPTPDPATQEEITVHYHNTKYNFTKFNVYVWYEKPSKVEIFGVWPGQSNATVTKEDNNWITFKFNVEKGHTVANDLKIIFNDGTHQTNDTEITATEVWINKNDVAYTSRELAEQAEASAETIAYTFYFYNSKKWTQILFHSWGAISTGNWGSVLMVAAPEVGADWYKYTYNSYSDLTGKTINIIISQTNDSTETKRITIGDYDKTKKNPLTIQEHTYYFNGNKDQQYFTTKDQALGTAAVALEAMLPVYDVKSYLGA